MNTKITALAFLFLTTFCISFSLFAMETEDHLTNFFETTCPSLPTLLVEKVGSGQSFQKALENLCSLAHTNRSIGNFFKDKNNSIDLIKFIHALYPIIRQEMSSLLFVINTDIAREYYFQTAFRDLGKTGDTDGIIDHYAPDSALRKALDEAINNDNLHKVPLLLCLGGSLTPEKESNTGTNFLQEAVETHNYTLVKICLETGKIDITSPCFHKVCTYVKNETPRLFPPFIKAGACLGAPCVCKNLFQSSPCANFLKKAVKDRNPALLNKCITYGNRDIHDISFYNAFKSALKSGVSSLVTPFIKSGISLDTLCRCQNLFHSKDTAPITRPCYFCLIPVHEALQYPLDLHISSIENFGLEIEKEIREFREKETYKFWKKFSDRGLVSYTQERPKERSEKEFSEKLLSSKYVQKMGIITALVEAGADINKQKSLLGGSLETPLYDLIRNSHSPWNKHVCQKKITCFVEWLKASAAYLSLFPDIHKIYVRTNTQKCPVEFLEGFVQLGANINVKNVFRRTPLHVSVQEQNSKIVEFLLFKGASADSSDIFGNTPLDEARGQTLSTLGRILQF
nr:hypothetical protein [Candidatus Dependentiae bacterium]